MNKDTDHTAIDLLHEITHQNFEFTNTVINLFTNTFV